MRLDVYGDLARSSAGLVYLRPLGIKRVFPAVSEDAYPVELGSIR